MSSSFPFPKNAVAPVDFAHKILEKSTGITNQIHCAVPEHDRSAFAMLAQIFPELSQIQSDAKDPVSPFEETRQIIYGAPFGIDAWIVADACRGTDDMLEKIRTGVCAFGLAMEGVPEAARLEKMSLSWHMKAPWIVMLETQKYAHPALYKRLDGTAQRLREIKPMWHRLAEAGTAVEPQRPGENGPSRLTVSCGDLSL